MAATAPVTLALVSSACFGLALVVTQFGLRHLSAAAGALVSIPMMAACSGLSPRSWSMSAAGSYEQPRSLPWGSNRVFIVGRHKQVA